METRLVRLTPSELGQYLERRATVTGVVRWNGQPVLMAEAIRRALELLESAAIAAHGDEVFVAG